MRKYEFIYILDPGLDEAAVNESLERYAKLIREQGGEIGSQEVWGRRKFAYDILKKSEGSYVYVRFKALQKAIDELNRVLRFDEKVLRTLIVLDEEAELRNEEARRNARPRASDEPAPAVQPGV
jgi:small subunit ribosomal protein S6